MSTSSKQFEIVNNFEDLIHYHFKDSINAVCWKRNLIGDFEEIASKLNLRDNITEIDEDDLLNLSLSENGKLAREVILNDLKNLRDCGAQPSLNLLRNYERDDEFDFISTDVYSFHVDRSPVGTDTFLCTYFGASSDIVANDEVELKINIPEIRSKLRALFDGPEEEFEKFLIENYFDMHYQTKANANPINLGLGHIWRLAVDHPAQEVLPCVHRAPVENPGECRLLLIC